MRMFTLSLICAALVAPGRLAAQADPGKKDRVITVIGVGTVKYKPEGAKVSFAIRASDQIFATAWRDNQTQSDKLREALERMKLAGAQIKVSPPEVVQGELGNGLAVVQQPMGMGVGALPYNVTRTFQVTVSDADFPELHKKVLKVMETALNHGVNSPPKLPGNHNEFIGGGFPQGGSLTRVEFFSRDDLDPRQQAYRKAVAAALENAKAAAQGAGSKLGDIVSIREQQDPALSLNANFGLGLPTADPPQQDVNGEIEVTVRVRVSAKF